MELSEKNKEIESLKEKMSIQKMNYDQLAEDYKEYRNQSASSVDEFKYKLQSEQDKYRQLNKDYDNYRFETIKQNKILQDLLREKEAENNQLVERIKKIQEEKRNLVETIHEFTDRMSGSIMPPVKDMQKEPTISNINDSSST